MAHGVAFAIPRTKLPLIGLLWLVGLPAAAAAIEFKLDLPLRCELGATCFIQNYVDHDSSKGVRDYQCGRRTYDGHDGTDIRVLDLKAQRDGVAVTAAAGGTVSAVRDGVDDISIRATGKAAVAGKECGNGAVIEHGEGWQSQYCHLAKGSLRVKVGERISSRGVIGAVGLSGATEFPHLHFTLRYLGRIVDPFAFGASSETCGSGRPLWNDVTRAQMQYRPREILNLGLSADPPTLDMVELGDMAAHRASVNSDAIVAYARVIGLQQGDREIILLYGPGGDVLVEHRPEALEGDKAQHLIFAGRKRKEASWPAGRYEIDYAVTRDGKKVLHRSVEIELRSRE